MPPATAEPWPEIAKLLASDGAWSDNFGIAVALSGETVLVGALWDDDNGSDSGSAYVLTGSGSTWTEQAKLLPSDGASDDNFGNAVALSDETMLIGAVRDDTSNGVNSGSVYVFVKSGGVWTQQAKLLAADGAANDVFGNSLALAGDTALIAAAQDDDDGVDSGSVYVFVRSGGVWTQQAKLRASDGAAQDYFGARVALWGGNGTSLDTALVGAWAKDDNGIYSGAAYVFVGSGGVWAEQAKLLPSNGAAREHFGRAVALSGNTAFVGAPGSGANGMSPGSVYVFERSGGVWVERAKLLASDGAADDHFGNAVALSGKSALFGAHDSDNENGLESGAAYMFVESSGTWKERAKLVAGDGAASDLFGNSVAILGDTALIGANGTYNEDRIPSGAAYIFRQPLFEDGFESGDTSAWSTTVPAEVRP